MQSVLLFDRLTREELASFTIFRRMKKVMDGCMKYISLVLMFSIAVMFAACGDDSSSVFSSSGKGSLLTLNGK